MFSNVFFCYKMIEKCEVFSFHFTKLILTGSSQALLSLSDNYAPLLRIIYINGKAVVKKTN